MSKFRNIKDYFTFSRNEQKGIIALMILIVIIMLIPPVYKQISPKANINADLLKETVDSFQTSLIEKKDSVKAPVIREQELFSFNPNTAAESDFKKLGFSDIAIKNLIRYKLKNGKFLKRDDLKKIYGITPAFYASISPYINVDSSFFITHKKKEEKSIPAKVIELNSADSVLILSIKGIGPVLTRRIVKFRNNLGGFYSVDQLTDVYGISDSLFLKIKSFCKVDKSLIQKICINKATVKDLLKHPYISKYQAVGILNFRKLQGCFKDEKQLSDSRIFPDSVVKKILPYIDFN